MQSSQNQLATGKNLTRWQKLKGCLPPLKESCSTYFFVIWISTTSTCSIFGEQKETVSWRQTEKGMKCSRYFKGGKHCPIKVSAYSMLNQPKGTYDHHLCHSIGITHLEHLLILINLLITSDEYNVSFSLDLKTWIG